MADKAKHAHGTSQNLASAIEAKKIDAFDVLFLDAGTDNPKMGWVDANGSPIIIDHKADLAKVESELEAEIATKVSAEEVDSKIKTALGEIECAPETYEKVKYEITDVPVGTLVDYREDEIRIMIPKDTEYHLQAVGTNGDANTFYVTLKTYVYNDDVVGYKEHLGSQVDAEILTDLKTDEYGRRYQPTWLGVAKYDGSTWSYYGANSSENSYIGWNYQLDQFDVDGKVIASDSIRINLSNENCHSVVEPYYVGKVMSEVDEKIAKAIEESATIDIIEF